jgi:hypothetical protein
MHQTRQKQYILASEVVRPLWLNPTPPFYRCPQSRTNPRSPCGQPTREQPDSHMTLKVIDAASPSPQPSRRLLSVPTRMRSVQPALRLLRHRDKPATYEPENKHPDPFFATRKGARAPLIACWNLQRVCWSPAAAHFRQAACRRRS